MNELNVKEQMGPKSHRPRLQDPARLAGDPQVGARLHGLEKAPWQSITAGELAPLLEVDVFVFNDWRYRQIQTRPPAEDPTGHRGRATRYRIDRLLAWSETGGLTIPHGDLWPFGADYLEAVFKLPRPINAGATDDLIAWLDTHGLATPDQGANHSRPLRPYGTV